MPDRCARKFAIHFKPPEFPVAQDGEPTAMTSDRSSSTTAATAATDRRSLPPIEVRGLSVGYGDGPDVLAGVDLTVHAGEIVDPAAPWGLTVEAADVESAVAAGLDL